MVLLVAAPSRAFDHGRLEDVLKAVVVQGRVHYGRLRGRQADLDAYLKALGEAKIGELGDSAARTAFWINAYNAVALANVLDAFPVGKVKDVPGFFEAKRRMVAGQSLSLDDIEKEKLAKELPDPRVHFALVCAAMSCPDLRAGAWSPETLDDDLDAAAKAFLGDPRRGARMDPDGGVWLSQVFRWYAKDFEKLGGIGKFVERLGLPAVAAAAKAGKLRGHLEYDWTLNAVELVGARRIPLLTPPPEAPLEPGPSPSAGGLPEPSPGPAASPSAAAIEPR